MNQTHAIIIDDNHKNVDVLARLLDEQGISCTAIYDPCKVGVALESIERFDIVFLDLEMPGMDGYELVGRLNANSRFESSPIVAYTVHVSEISAASKHGFHSFLGKPIDPERFPFQLARILDGERVWETV